MARSSIGAAHYSKVSVDDLPVEAFLDRYFAKLDKQKLYFTEKEVEKFKNKYSTTIISLFKRVIFYRVLKYLIPTKKYNVSPEESDKTHKPFPN